mgnify:CR=1 FL=1
MSRSHSNAEYPLFDYPGEYVQSKDGEHYARTRIEAIHTQFERVQLRELVILKRNGRRTPFDRDKLERSLGIALRKRPVQPEQVEQMVSRIVRQLESLGETEIHSSTVGDFIMKALKSVDEVAYVRYASVYKDFRHTGDFARFLGDEGLDDETGGR